MATTTWLPRAATDQRSWLLTNGEVIQEPALEETASGRKVRIAGTSISAFSKDVDELITQAVGMLARQKQTRVWMPLGDRAAAEVRSLGFRPADEKAQLHFLTEGKKSTNLWWRFKHASLPIEAILAITVSPVGYGAGKEERISTRISMPSTALDEERLTAVNYIEHTMSWTDLLSMTRWDYTGLTKGREFVRDNPPEWGSGILGVEQYASERLTVSALLNKVRKADELARIQVPDFRDPDNLAWLEMELYETNVNQQFVADLVEYLDGSHSVEKAQAIYQDLLNTLRSIGVVLGNLSENDFSRAMNGGGNKVLSVPVHRVSGEGGGRDSFHALQVHLATGTFVVDCSHSEDKDAVAHKWEEALLVAQLSGQEDTLLAYAREYARREGERRVKEIVDARKDGKIPD